jgi:hypothetical protein
LLKPIWLEIRARLEQKRDEISREIRNYPPPIPACDQHFNYLLEERARVSAELNRVDELSGESPARRNDIELIEEFIGSSTYINDETKWTIRARLKGSPG